VLELTEDGVAEDSEGPGLVLTPVADSGDTSASLTVALRAELALDAVNVTPVPSPVMPTAGLVTDSGEVRARPLEPVAELEAGLIPSVPGFIVGNEEEPSKSVAIELGRPVNGPVLLRDVCDIEGEGSVGIKPET